MEILDFKSTQQKFEHNLQNKTLIVLYFININYNIKISRKRPGEYLGISAFLFLPYYHNPKSHDFRYPVFLSEEFHVS